MKRQKKFEAIIARDTGPLFGFSKEVNALMRLVLYSKYRIFYSTNLNIVVGF
eukprot:TRINITY_DN5471_c0_g1_i1.p1 TRINITY_DN5471_c0_g1~~TRINITY_DN5471_c0_g1_i1.p1  ORF type:complete len:52 (+),score=1.41 TRINITY_DN5471_c0_g1_i1:83-238(+)